MMKVEIKSDWNWLEKSYKYTLLQRVFLPQITAIHSECHRAGWKIYTDPATTSRGGSRLSASWGPILYHCNMVPRRGVPYHCNMVPRGLRSKDPPLCRGATADDKSSIPEDVRHRVTSRHQESAFPCLVHVNLRWYNPYLGIITYT